MIYNQTDNDNDEKIEEEVEVISKKGKKKLTKLKIVNYKFI